MASKPFDIEQAIPLLRRAVALLPKAAMFQLAEEGYDSLYEQLVSCIISICIYDEVSIPVSQRLFGQARTLAQMVTLKVQDSLELIQESPLLPIRRHRLIRYRPKS